jgi:type VI secretion system secreted protein Hcp
MTSMYIKFTGPDIAGESTDAEHEEWIEVDNWEHQFDQPTSPTKSSVGGGTVERVNHHPFTFQKYIDSGTDDLLKMCWTGQHIDKAEFHAYRADGTGEATQYLKVEMEKVIVADYTIVGSDGELPREEIELDYGKITYTYTPQEKTGEVGSAQPVSHDLTTNEVA